MRALPFLTALLLVAVLGGVSHGRADFAAETKPYVAWGVGVGVEDVKPGVPFVYHTAGANPAPLDVPASATFTLSAPAHVVSVLIQDAASRTVGWGMCVMWDGGIRCKDGTLARSDSLIGDLTHDFPAGARVNVYVWSVATDPLRSLVGVGTIGTATLTSS